MKTLDLKIHTHFRATINNVSINSERIYYSLIYILESIISHYDGVVPFNNNFIRGLAEAIDIIYYKYDSTSMNDIENQFTTSLKDNLPFHEQRFTVWDNDWKFEWFNENLHQGKYNR